MCGQALLRRFVQVLAVAVVYLISQLVVHFALQGRGVPAEDPNLLSLRVVEDPVDRVVFGLDCHDELRALVGVHSKDVEEVTELFALVEGFRRQDPVVSVAGQRLFRHLFEEAGWKL